MSKHSFTSPPLKHTTELICSLFVPFAPLPDLPDERVEGVDDALARLGRRHEQRATVELGQALGLLVVNLAINTDVDGHQYSIRSSFLFHPMYVLFLCLQSPHRIV